MKINTQLVIIAALVLVGTAFSDPIHDAAMYGNLEGIQAELDKGVDVNAKNDFGETPLDMALWLKGANETVDLILNHGGKTSKELIALSDAVRTGNIEDVSKHLAAGADVNAKDMYEVTPLYEAVKLGYNGIVELLLANGADVNVKNNAGWVPLHMATALDHKQIVELLVASGANVDAKDDVGSTPLHYAAWYDRTEVAELVIAGGADVNMKDENGWTPLHYSTDAVLMEISGLLMEHGADVNAKDVDGKTPLDWAIQLNQTEIADFFRKHGSPTIPPVEVPSPMPHLIFDKATFGFSFTTKDKKTYVIEETRDFKHWSELETIKGTGKQIKFTDPRQPLVSLRNFYRVKVVD
jgi:ankyrin repeat protein